ncbi:tryptophan halogenase family protein [Pseudoalteromonas piscicida]|uniref:Tryptophan halogenase n=1 Tax=Pseudoalteromonas piscicida TaxID=43662 RepID=A0A2A5JLG9_PSEO7|nr:tryptophan halogenase family protein [Pseudoalteromonas piscicida]PCK30294.1 tryptophan halogenase [Pseudoalteromonas piscicida]
MKKIHSLTILGGGTAGWMCAAYLAKHQPNLSITVIESPSIGRIGVGEGSTPHLQHFMQSLGVHESDWMPACQASYKTGIYFDNWNGDNGSYFHPFFSEMDAKTAEVYFVNANARRRGSEYIDKPEHYFLAAVLANKQQAPQPQRSLPRTLEYGYHFDAQKLADWLREFSLTRHVKHLQSTVNSVQHHAQEVIGLTLESGEQVKSDFYVDASGFNALLIEKALEVPFISFTDQLLNDSAVAIAGDIINPLPSSTSAIAMPCGWRWQIPLQDRTGHGYVYSSAHITAKQAETQLRQAAQLDKGQAKHLTMRVGMMARSIEGNVFAIGLAQSFIEPLEATALMVTSHSIELLNRLLSQQLEAEAINQQLSDLVLGIKEYVLAHYATSKRVDTRYWQDAKVAALNVSELDALLTHWRGGGDFDAWLHQYRQQSPYIRPSWYCLLGGMDHRDSSCHMHFDQAPQHIEQAAKAYLEKLCDEHFIDHTNALEQLQRTQAFSA